MKINKTQFYRTVFTLVLLMQMYLPSFKVNVFFQLSVLFLYFILEKPTVSIRLLKIILPIIFVFLLGFLGTIIYQNPILFVLKDVFHFIKPLQGILIGYFFFKTINNEKLFVKTIVQIALLSAIIHFFIIILFVDLNSGDVHAIREFTRDNFLELVAIFFLGYHKRFFNEELFNSKNKSRLIFTILFISCILYFSRTMIVGALILFSSVKGYTRITQKSIKIITIAIFGVFILYGYLYSVKIDRSKPGLEAFLYKVKIAPEELFQTKIDRDNHKELWDHWRGYESKRAFALMDDKPLSYLSGTGYGSLVNLKFKAPLAGDNKGMKFISELHNGYPYVLYKTGMVGLILYLAFLFGLYKIVYSKPTFETIFISGLGVFYLFTTLTITGIYNTSDTTVFVLGALIYGLTNITKRHHYDKENFPKSII